MDPTSPITVAVAAYLNYKDRARKEKTAKIYGRILGVYLDVLKEHKIDPAAHPLTDLTADTVPWLLDRIKYLSGATEALYMAAVSDFFRYLQSEDVPVNAIKIAYIMKAQARHKGRRIPNFQEEDVEKLLEYADQLRNQPAKDDQDNLIHLRDRALMITLADTGLRISEALHLLRGDINYQKRQAVIIGKADKQALVRFSQRSIRAIQDYLRARAALDGGTGKPLASLPLFVRHDRGAGKPTKPLTPAGAERIIHGHVLACLGEGSEITPHTLRHYFVTRVVRSKGIEVARRLARHESTQVTARYTHLTDQELDEAYKETFEEET